jgi:predicted ribosome quality control (RQC) complex YloA/Tae2 family protein
MKTEVFVHENTNYNIIIGKNATDNTKIVKNASPSDVWFHVLDKPSCHVILVNEHKINAIPRQVIKRCAYLCKINSSSSSKSTKCPIIYTSIDNVKCTDIDGQVTTSSNKTICL